MNDPNRKMIPKDSNGVLYVLGIGRVSTEQQQLSNIDASIEWAQTMLARNYNCDGPMRVKPLGEQASGMRTDRKTIREAEDEIESDAVDVVLAEDLSRIYRNPRHLFAFIQDCVDRNVRVICPGDNFDTWDENWEVTLSAGALRHGLFIPDTRRRVRRTAAYAFPRGGMVFKPRFGYRKLTKEEATSGAFGPIGLRLAKRPEHTAIFQQLRELVVRHRIGGEQLAEWLNAQHIQLPPYTKRKNWTGRLVLSTLRDPILWGCRQYPKQRYTMRFRDGSHVREKNANPDTKYYPELAHMTEQEWLEMVKVLHELAPKSSGHGGRDHPRYRVRRKDSVLPLQHATCGGCGAFFYLSGPDVIKCKNAFKHGPDRCWNHVQVSRAVVREKFVHLLLERLQRHPQAMEALIGEVWQQVQRGRKSSDAQVNDVDKDIENLQCEAKNLAAAIAQGGKLATLLTQLKIVEKSLKQARQRRDEVLDVKETTGLPASKEALALEPRAALLELARTSFEFADLMRRIFPRFLIQPVQQLDSGQVRPRAYLTLDLGALQEGATGDSSRPPVEELTVNLFERPLHIKHLDDIVALKLAMKQRCEQASLKALAANLGVGHMTVQRALTYWQLMQAEGLLEPYRVLREPPARASRWKPRKSRAEASTSKLGEAA